MIGLLQKQVENLNEYCKNPDPENGGKLSDIMRKLNDKSHIINIISDINNLYSEYSIIKEMKQK